MKELFGYPPVGDLPSLDVDCLYVHYYMQACHIVFQYHPCSSTRVSPTNVLPMLRDGENLVTGANEILAYLKKQVACLYLPL